MKGKGLLSVPDLRAFLSGDWQIERSVVDRRHSISGKFGGHACFTPDGTSLLYEERGTLDFGDHRGFAEQRYRFDFDATGARAIVSFRDGRSFYELDLSNGDAAVAHMCDPDLYEGRFTALGPNQWKSNWKVAGPRKDQDILTLYIRLG